MKQNRWKHKGGYWVVHEGLQNNPDIKVELEKISNEINDVASNESRHLSDSALIVNSLSERLEEISKNLFNLHDVEKKDGVKES